MATLRATANPINNAMASSKFFGYHVTFMPSIVTSWGRSCRDDAGPDYTKITAPALSFVTIYDAPYIPADADAALRERIIKRWNDYGNPFQRHKIDHFKRDMKNGKVIELDDTDHGDFVRNANFQKFLIREMRKFRLGE